MEQYNFTLTNNQINIIMNALANRPYGEVFELIGEIQKQAMAQEARNND